MKVSDILLSAFEGFYFYFITIPSRHYYCSHWGLREVKAYAVKITNGASGKANNSVWEEGVGPASKGICQASLITWAASLEATMKGKNQLPQVSVWSSHVSLHSHTHSIHIIYLPHTCTHIHTYKLKINKLRGSDFKIYALSTLYELIFTYLFY